MKEIIKKDCRKKALHIRDKIAQKNRIDKSIKICSELAKIFDEYQIQTNKKHLLVASYSQIGSEVDLSHLEKTINKEHVTFAMPCIDFHFDMHFFLCPYMILSKHTLDFLIKPTKKYAVDSVDFLHKLNKAGVRKVKPQEIDVILVPMVAFDKGGTRLGYGGGCYDKYIPKLRDNTLILGIAFKEQRMEKLPSENHDIKLKKIVSA